MKHYNRAELSQKNVANHAGIFRKKISLLEGIALMVSGTIGAGVLGIPYAVSRVGAVIGISYILILGALMTGLNLLLGSVLSKTGSNYHLSSLARKYLGRVGEWLMTGLFYISTLGILMTYIIGEGETLAELFGGDPYMWGSAFLFFGALIIFTGMRTVKTVEFILSIAILAILFLIIIWSGTALQWEHLRYVELSALFFPYGIVLFAFSGTAVVPEVHSILHERSATFKKVIIWSGLIITGVYVLFALMVVGVTGPQTTEIATIGLGKALGGPMFIFGNIFAVIAMATSFFIIGLSLRDSLVWDYKFPRVVAGLLVCGVPYLIYSLGIQQFALVMGLVGGVFVSLGMILTVLIYMKSKKERVNSSVSSFFVEHDNVLVWLLLIALTVGTVQALVSAFL